MYISAKLFKKLFVICVKLWAVYDKLLNNLRFYTVEKNVIFAGDIE